jgi:hypothetical protein
MYIGHNDLFFVTASASRLRWRTMMESSATVVSGAAVVLALLPGRSALGVGLSNPRNFARKNVSGQGKAERKEGQGKVWRE